MCCMAFADTITGQQMLTWREESESLGSGRECERDANRAHENANKLIKTKV